jgi:hypothetical protein
MYDPWIFELDLCILSYQLHSQTLIWPMDPYYEQYKEERRKKFLEAVYARMPEFQQNNGWRSNYELEAAVRVYRYLEPWRPGFTRPDRHKDKWVLYHAPREITDPITQVHMVKYRDNLGPFHQNQNRQNPTFETVNIHANRPAYVPAPPGGADLLYCFEGATGHVDAGTIPAWSMMGFALARDVTPAELGLAGPIAAPVPYDVHIAFRGSRSGKLRLAKSKGGKGAPDWVTDLGVTNAERMAEISDVGKVRRGFGLSLYTCLPALQRCLEAIHAAKGRPPRTIHVTGHSLGAALAGLWSSAMMCGANYGPRGMGQQMPAALKQWPWHSLQLTMFSSPLLGDWVMHGFVDSVIACRRAVIYGDVICAYNSPMVGVEYQIPPKINTLTPGQRHDPYYIRRNLIRALQRNRLPITNIPASGVENPQTAPWQIVTKFADVVQILQNIQPGPALTQYLRDFRTHFINYLKCLEDAETAINAQTPTVRVKTAFTTIRAPIDRNPPDINTFVTLNNGWDRIKNDLSVYTDKRVYKDNFILDNFVDFLGLCLCLLAVSEGISLANLKNGASKIAASIDAIL